MAPSGNIDNKPKEEQALRAFLRQLFSLEKLAVIATVEDGQPFTNLVAFAATEDLQHIYFATPRATRKFHNLKDNPKISMTVDNRKNLVSDFSDAAAVMAIGTAHEVAKSESKTPEEMYLTKHPYLKDFVTAPSCALIDVKVTQYDIVQQFQKVTVLRCEHGCGSESQ